MSTARMMESIAIDDEFAKEGSQPPATQGMAETRPLYPLPERDG